MGFNITLQASIYLSLMVVLMGCQEPPQLAVTPAVKLVKVITLSDEGAGKYRNFPAIVEATENALLAFRVSGQLKQLLVLPGAVVQQGDLLAKLDPTDYQLALESAQANYDLALSQFKRAEQLISQQLVSRSGFDESKAQLQVTDAALKVAKTNLAYTELHAPFDGQVAQRFVQNFENITAQQSILALQKNKDIDIAIQLPEDFLANIDKTTQYQPEVRFEAQKKSVFRAKLKEYDTEANSATKSFKVVFSLPTPTDFNVLPGMSATVSIELNKVMKTNVEGWNIPAQAIFAETLNNEKHSYVWLVNDDNILELTKVTLGGIHEKGFTVISGLKYGDRIVAAGVQMLNAGDAVRVWQKERGL
ncbi:efflux RND transporter periplasmic adaptor subunit [Paraglaciecola sp.]|uniref:efflux RND transporter periplasmic adaptor subunit n=1 Tax=Paraglaciecola sp. TaxID=1920173 RepID=UPI0030F3CCA5